MTQATPTISLSQLAGHLWESANTLATNVGNALQRAMRKIEKANPDT